MDSIGGRTTEPAEDGRGRGIVLRHVLLACLLVAVPSAGCSRGGGGHPGPKTVAVDGQEMETGRPADAVAGLCLARQQASTDPRAARATYDSRSRLVVAETARALQPSYSLHASAMVEAAGVVEGDTATDPPSATLAADLARLTEVTREGLARLGIVTPPCAR